MLPIIQALDEDALQTSRSAALSSAPQGSSDVWLFVYGALAAAPPFAFAERVVARLAGQRRSFCLSDPINRGTAQAPGLTLGLEPGDGCDGLLFRIAEADLRESLSAVWRQEMRFPLYGPAWREVETPMGPVTALVFETNRASPLYEPERDEAEMVARLARCAGPSGTNAAYLAETADAFRAAGRPDPYLERLIARLAAPAILPAEPRAAQAPLPSTPSAPARRGASSAAPAPIPRPAP